MYTPEQMLEWVRSLPKEKRRTKKLALLEESLDFEAPSYIPQRTKEEFNGKGTERGKPELMDCIRLTPTDISEAPPMFWPREVKKIVLMSATIGPKDIEQMGLGKRRVIYIDCKSPIPRGNRPIITLNTVSVNRQNMDTAVVKLAQEIQGIADYHAGEKGLVHATYQLATHLSTILDDSRYIFHNRHNKAEKYREFRESPPEFGKILVASGMYEGIDLPEDLGRWQAIAKVPWMSLGNPAIRYLAERDPEWFHWETLKVLIQACGRICRTPTDHGITYILDSSVNRLFEEAVYMMPQWWLDAIVE
jgi:Rad3-related DNA helicase